MAIEDRRMREPAATEYEDEDGPEEPEDPNGGEEKDGQKEDRRQPTLPLSHERVQHVTAVELPQR